MVYAQPPFAGPEAVLAYAFRAIGERCLVVTGGPASLAGTAPLSAGAQHPRLAVLFEQRACCHLQRLRELFYDRDSRIARASLEIADIGAM